MSLLTFLNHLINGISLGSVYAIIALGYTMVYGIAKMLNFAHGDVIMVGAYVCFFATQSFGLPPLAGVLLAMAVCTALGITIERLAYKPLRSAPRMSIMISAIGVSFFLENFATYLFTGLPKAFPAIPFLQIPIVWGSVNLQSVTIITPIVTIVLVVSLMFLVNRTKMGMAMRAASKDFETAQLMGIKINRVISFTFAVGSLLAAAGAILYLAPRPMVYPYIGMMPGLKCFVAAVLGGIGSIPGACIGGFIIGTVETFLVALFPNLSGYSDAFTFILLILMLLVRPTGLLGEKMTDKV